MEDKLNQTIGATTGVALKQEAPLSQALNRQRVEIIELRNLVFELRDKLNPILNEKPVNVEDCEARPEPIKIIDIIENNSNEISKENREIRQIISELVI